MRYLKLFTLLLSLQLIFPYQLLAKPGNAPFQPSARPGSVPVQHAGTTANTTAGATAAGSLNLNLGSTQSSISAAILGLTKSININVGGVSQVVNSSSLLTPAEFAAASQVVSGSAQTLSIGASGNAIGGKLSLTSTLISQLSGLVIPQGVKLVDNFGSLGALQLSGNFVDSGKFIAMSSNPGVTNAVINANNIYVQAGGLLSSVGGSQGAAGLSLTLNALNNLVNSGTITSSGSLNVAAGGTITNALPTGATGASPVMQAANNVSLTSGTIVNTGLVNALAGNITLASLNNADLNINNAGGTLQALNGAINLQNANYSGTGNTNLNGGNVLSQALNINAGNGVADVNVGQLTGTVNAVGYGVHVMTATNDLQLGNINAIDPTFYNTPGSISLSGTINVSEDLTIVAAGSITDSAPTTINTQFGGGAGHIVNIIAGADINVASWGLVLQIRQSHQALMPMVAAALPARRL